MRPSPKPSTGVTLIESLVALAVLAIMLALALPSMRGLMERQRTASTINELIVAIQLARSIAITRRTVAVICPSHDGRRCTRGIDWSQGWIVFDAPDRAGQPTADSRIEQHVDRGAVPALQIHASTGRRALRYQALGFSGGSNLTLRICRDDTLHARVIVNNTGRPRSETPRRKARCHD